MPSKTVLIVDDESLIRWSLKERLEQAGYRVLEAASGQEALDYFERHEGIDATLLDLKLPDMDGMAVLKRIKKEDPGCQVILMTAFGMPQTANEAILLGARDFVGKPFQIDDMLRRVEKAIGKADGGGPSAAH